MTFNVYGIWNPLLINIIIIIIIIIMIIIVPVRARWSAPVQIGPRAHPTSCTVGTGSLSWG